MNRYTIPYRSHTITGVEGCKCCYVELNSADFQWEILCPSVHSAKIHISKHITRERIKELAALREQQIINKEK